jgi:hypothetical protein
MRLRRTLPMVTMRLSRGQSQQENAVFPQFSWGFMPFLAISPGFSRFLAILSRILPPKNTGEAHLPPDHFGLKSASHRSAFADLRLDPDRGSDL